MNRFFKGVSSFVSGFLVAAVCTLAIPMVALADPSTTLDLPTSVNLSALFPYASAIIAALVTLIVIRKAIKLSNRS